MIVVGCFRKVVFSFILTSAVTSESLGAPIIINDNYVGGGATNSGWSTADVIGDTDHFGVSKMEVDFTASQLSVSIFSSYFDNVGESGTDLGDLFIASTGWHPVGVSPYYQDTLSTSKTKWDYALVIEHKKPNPGKEINMLGFSGIASLYQIPSQSYLVTADLPGSVYRADQIVEVKTNGLKPVGTGSWSISDVLGSQFDKLMINIALSNFVGLQDSIGLRWQMTCANDVIEGAASSTVPEPTTAALLSLGALGFFRRRNFL